MLAASFHDVIAADATNRASWQAGFGAALVGMPKDILVEHNAWFDLLWAEYAWWGNPYELAGCTDAPTLVQNPAGYLLPYWMARYHGFIGPDE